LLAVAAVEVTTHMALAAAAAAVLSLSADIQ
jgi:hypothetical protein